MLKTSSQDNYQKIYNQDLILATKYHFVVQKVRDFFLSRGFIEVPTQSRRSILAACEDPKTIQTYTFENTHWPLPQTGQMWLEYELLTNPQAKGFFCISTSYRQEPNPIPERHKTIFPMFEFETHGGLNTLAQLEKDLIIHMNLAESYDDIKSISYLEAAKFYGVTELSSIEENNMYNDFGKALLLESFPIETSPFWNMKMNSNANTAKKIDVILGGQETIGSAERATDKQEMKELFYTISNGEYANILFNQFGKERVEKELTEYLSLDFFERCGGGIGITRLIQALEKENIL